MNPSYSQALKAAKLLAHQQALAAQAQARAAEQDKQDAWQALFKTRFAGLLAQLTEGGFRWFFEREAGAVDGAVLVVKLRPWGGRVKLSYDEHTSSADILLALAEWRKRADSQALLATALTGVVVALLAGGHLLNNPLATMLKVLYVVVGPIAVYQAAVLFLESRQTNKQTVDKQPTLGSSTPGWGSGID